MSANIFFSLQVVKIISGAINKKINKINPDK